MTPRSTRRASIILLLVAVILWLASGWFMNASLPNVVNGINNGGVVFYGYMYYVSMVGFLFLLPFSITSLIFPKWRLMIRMIIGIIFIWPTWILMWVVPGPNFGRHEVVDKSINIINEKANSGSGVISVPQAIKK